MSENINKNGRTTKEILQNAKQLIVRRGWWDGSSVRDENVCAVMAISECAYGTGKYYEVTSQFGSANDIDCHNISGWNDKQTEEVVLAAFDKAIDRAD